MEVILGVAAGAVAQQELAIYSATHGAATRRIAGTAFRGCALGSRVAGSSRARRRRPLARVWLLAAAGEGRLEPVSDAAACAPVHLQAAGAVPAFPRRACATPPTTSISAALSAAAAGASPAGAPRREGCVEATMRPPSTPSEDTSCAEIVAAPPPIGHASPTPPLWKHARPRRGRRRRRAASAARLVADPRARRRSLRSQNRLPRLGVLTALPLPLGAASSA